MSEQIELEEAKLPLNQQSRHGDRRCRKPFKEKRRSIGSITRSFAISTSCHGIPRIAAVKSVHRRSLWTLVVIIVLSAYISHLSELLRWYVQYPVRINVITESNGTFLQFPAITLCNANKVRLSHIVQNRPDIALLLNEIKAGPGRRKRRRRDSLEENTNQDIVPLSCGIELRTDRRGSKVWSEQPIGRVDTVTDCCNVCKETPGCMTWTFEETSSEGNCWLNNEQVTPIQTDCCHSGVVDTTMGPNRLHPTENITMCAIQINVTTTGAAIRTVTMNSSDECCDGCIQNKDCIVWTFDKIRNICELKDSVGETVLSECCDTGIASSEQATSNLTLLNETQFDALEDSISNQTATNTTTIDTGTTTGTSRLDTRTEKTDTTVEASTSTNTLNTNSQTQQHKNLSLNMDSTTKENIDIGEPDNVYTYGPHYDASEIDFDGEYSVDNLGWSAETYIATLFDDVIPNVDLYIDQNFDVIRPSGQDTALSQLRSALKTLSASEVLKYGHQAIDMVVDCTYNGIPCFIGELPAIQDAKYGNCYSVNFTFEDDMRASTKSGSDNGLKLTVFAEQDEYIGPVSDGIGFRVIIHHSLSQPFPKQMGIDIPPGSATSIGVNMVAYERLQHPYTNDCTDQRYIEGVHNYGYSLKACQNACLQSYLYLKCNCTDEVKEGFPTCSGGLSNLTEVTCVEFVYYLHQYDLLPCDCNPSCWEYTYTSTISHRTWPADNFIEYLLPTLQKNENEKLRTLNDTQAIRKNLATIEVYFEDLNYIIMKEEPAYQSAQLWADIGGSLGLWIGISVVTVIEAVELLIDLLVHIKRRGIQCQLLPDAETTLRSPNRR